MIWRTLFPLGMTLLVVACTANTEELAPNASTGETASNTAVQIAPTVPWPTNREGLVFLWQCADVLRYPALAYDSQGAPIRSFSLTHRKRRHYDRHYAMVLRDCSFHAKGAGAFLAETLKKTNAFTLEAYITPADLTQKGPAEIISFSSGPTERNFSLGQDSNRLVFSLSAAADRERDGPAWVSLWSMEDTKPFHLSITFDSGVLQVYRNGEKVFEKDYHGDLKNWASRHLVFGNEWTSTRDWVGRLEGIAIYRRALPPGEIREQAHAYLGMVSKRTPAPRITLIGKLLKRSPTEPYEEVKPYYQALSVFEYEVERVLGGSLLEKRVCVAHWTMIDTKILPIAERPLGKPYEIVMEPFDAHRQLKSDLLHNDADGDLDSTLYYDVSEEP